MQIESPPLIRALPCRPRCPTYFLILSGDSRIGIRGWRYPCTDTIGFFPRGPLSAICGGKATFAETAPVKAGNGIRYFVGGGSVSGNRIRSSLCALLLSFYYLDPGSRSSLLSVNRCLD